MVGSLLLFRLIARTIAKIVAPRMWPLVSLVQHVIRYFLLSNRYVNVIVKHDWYVHSIQLRTAGYDFQCFVKKCPTLLHFSEKVLDREGHWFGATFGSLPPPRTCFSLTQFLFLRLKSNFINFILNIHAMNWVIEGKGNRWVMGIPTSADEF